MTDLPTDSPTPHPVLTRLREGLERRLSQLSGPPRVPIWVEGACSEPLREVPLAEGEVLCLVGLGNLPSHREAFQAAAEALPPGSPLFLGALGAGTLPSLHPVLTGVGLEAWVPPDLHDLGDALVQAGFEAPVMEAVRLRLRFATVADAIRDVAGHAALFGLSPTSPGAFGQVSQAQNAPPIHWLRPLCRALQAERRLPLDLPVELVFGHAWRARPRRTAAHEPAPVRIYRPGKPSGFSPF